MAGRRPGQPRHGRLAALAQPVEMRHRTRLDGRDHAQDGEGDEGGHEEERAAGQDRGEPRPVGP